MLRKPRKRKNSDDREAGGNRLDVFGLGTDNTQYHKAWTGNSWQPQREGLGGIFNIPPGP